jgi:hypothetical protein
VSDLDRRSDGTLIRRDVDPFSAAALRARAGVIDHGEELLAIVDEREVWCVDCGYGLDWHDADARCPTEAEARERSGSQ